MTRAKILGIQAVLVFTMIVGRPVAAQDAPTANPATVHVTFENDKVRILESALPPGATSRQECR